MEQIPCADGYLLDPKSPLADGHHALNQYLVRVEEAGWQQALKEINSVRDKARKLVTWKALIERLRWLRDNSPHSDCLSPLRGLAERVEKWTLSLTEADLIDILERTAEVAGFATPYTPMPHLMAYIEKNGLTPRLAAAIREFRERVWDQGYTVNQVSLQLFRSRMDMLAWRDEWTEIDLKRCWSEQVRADYRALRGAERENWRRLLHSIHGDEGTRPAPRWQADAQALVQAIGTDAFRAAQLRWFEPLQPGRPQRLSREGSYLLRAFIWLAESLNDAELLTAVGRISGVEFKPKNNGEKVLRAAAEATGKPDPTVKPAAPAPSLESMMTRALEAVLAPHNALVAGKLAGRVQIGGGIAYVRGDLDSYEVHLSSGAIFRARDGRRVRLPAAAPVSGEFPFPNFAGVTELIRHILLLAEDSKHAGALTLEP